MDKKIAVVSACLLGHMCRYDGAQKGSLAVQEALSSFQIIPFCPEVHDLGVPRPRIAIFHKQNQLQLIKEDDQCDVTAFIRSRTLELLAHTSEPELCILKAKSPSCALNSVLHHTISEPHTTVIGDGVAAQLLKQQWRATAFLDETLVQEIVSYS